MSAARTALDAGRRIVRYDLRRIASLTATVLAVAACADMPTAPAAPTPAVPTPEPLAIAAEPSGPVFQGVFLGDAPSHRDQIRASIQSFGSRVGKAPALVKTFFKVGDDYSATGWVGQVLREVSRAGSTNFVALDLRWAGAPASGLLSALTSGAADDVLRRAARGFADIGSPVLVELGWEMNGNWDYPWQGVYNGGAEQGARAYVAAWRHIVSVFRAEGAANVRWVFSPVAGNPVAGRGVGPDHWNWYGHYYPGEEYVDYIGLHGFNGPSVWNTPFLTFADLFDAPATDRMLSDVERRHPDKPILISEFACEETALGDKAAWVRDAYRSIAKHPGIVGAIWFDMRKEADWRIDSSMSALDAYRDAVSSPSVKSRFDESIL
jgi:hypothetical protein